MNRLVKYENPVSTFVKLWENSPFGWNPWNPGVQHSSYLQENISKTADGYTIQLLVPGIPKEDLNVEFQGDTLRIDRKGDYLRSYRLPQDANSEGISAELRDGILTLQVPLNKPPAVKIEVRQG